MIKIVQRRKSDDVAMAEAAPYESYAAAMDSPWPRIWIGPDHYISYEKIENIAYADVEEINV